MRIRALPHELTVCKLGDAEAIDLTADLVFVARTDEELSLVCPTAAVPTGTLEREDGWRAFRIEGVLEFSLIGILAKISAVLAQERIGIFVVSTYNTDYVLVKAADLDRALDALGRQGYEVER